MKRLISGFLCVFILSCSTACFASDASASEQTTNTVFQTTASNTTTLVSTADRSTLGDLMLTPDSANLSCNVAWSDSASGLSYTVDVRLTGSPRTYFSTVVDGQSVLIDTLLPNAEFTITVTENKSKKAVVATLQTESVKKYSEYGAVPNMANFLYIKPDDLAKVSYSFNKAKHNKIKTIKVDDVKQADTEAFYYIYLKWTYGKTSPDHVINQLFFLQTPSNELYASETTDSFEGLPSRWYWYWFVSMDDIMGRYQAEHPQMEVGKYVIWSYFNNCSFRKTEFTVK